ncbi:g5692 [Coccomyxa elongata]
MGQVRSSLQMRRGADFFILVSIVVLVGALLDWSSPRGLQAAALQADSFRPLDVVGLDGAASLCPGLRTGHPTFLRQRMAALVRGRLWSSPVEGMEEGSCEGPSLVVSMAERSLVIFACLLALACLLSALFLPRRQLAQLAPGKWLAQLRAVLLGVWTRRKAEQRKQSAAHLLRSAMRSGDKECLSAALDEAEDAKVDLPLLRRATVALRELRRKAAKVAKKGKSSRGDPAHRRSASPTRRRRSSRSASPGAGSRASDGAPRPTEAEGIPPFLQGSSESSGDFSIPAGKAGTTHAGGLDAKDAGGSPKAAGPAREADRDSPPLSSEPSMSLSQQSSLSAHSGAVPQPAAPPQPERQNPDRHAQHHGAGKGPHLVRDSVGELAAAVAMKVEALEKERERQREEKRQMRSKEAAERAAAAAQDKAAEVPNVRVNAKAEKVETGASTPKAAGRAVSFFGRKAAPVGTASPAGSGNGGDREWRWAGGKKEKPVAVPIEPVTPRPARRTPAVVLTVPRPQHTGAGRGIGNGKGDAGKKQAAPGTPVSPVAAAMPGWSKKFSRHTSSAPTTPNGKYAPGPDGALPVGQGLAAASLLGQPPEPPPPPPPQPPRLYAQVARDGTGTQQERPSTAPPSGKRTPPPTAPATPASPRFENGNGMFATTFPPASGDPPTAAIMGGAHQPSSLFLGGLGGFAGFLGGGHAPPQASAAEALSPFPGMSLHRRVAPPVRGPDAFQGGSDIGQHARGLPSYNAMPLAPPSIPYRNFDNIWSSASTVEPLPIGTSPPGWNPMGMRCRTSAAPEWKPVPGPGLSPLQFASDPLPPLEATLLENPPAAAAATAPVITGALSERSASGSVTGPSGSHFSSVSTSSSLEGW